MDRAWLQETADRLSEQREFLLADGNTWWKGSPRTAGHACMVERTFLATSDLGDYAFTQRTALFPVDIAFLRQAIWDLHRQPQGFARLDGTFYLHPSPLTVGPTWWNDMCARSLDEVIEVMNYALKLVQQAMEGGDVLDPSLAPYLRPTTDQDQVDHLMGWAPVCDE